MKKLSQRENRNVIATLMKNVKWDAVDSSVLQKILDKPHEVGRQFTTFLQNGGRVLSDISKIITIDRTFDFDPVTFIGPGWSSVKGEHLLAFTEVDLNKIIFETTLKEGENSVVGEEKLKRLIAAGCVRLDAKVFQTLWENQHLIPEAWKHPTNGKITYIFFDEITLQDPNGDDYVLCLYWSNGNWGWSYRSLDLKWFADAPSAVLAS